MSRLEVSIPEELEPYIDRAVTTGRFESTEALVVEAIRRMAGMEVSNQQLAEIRSKIDEGYAQAMRGELVEASRVREQLVQRSLEKPRLSR